MGLRWSSGVCQLGGACETWGGAPEMKGGAVRCGAGPVRRGVGPVRCRAEPARLGAGRRVGRAAGLGKLHFGLTEVLSRLGVGTCIPAMGR